MLIFYLLYLKENLKIVKKSANNFFTEYLNNWHYENVLFILNETVSYLFDLECVTLVKLLNNETKV